MVELAIVLPLMVMLMFGTVEASWAFAVANDVRHGAREGARLAAVDYGDVTTIATEVCDRMDIVNGNVTVALSDASAGADDGARGSEGKITVSITYQSLTGIFDTWMGGKTINSDIDFILEQPVIPEGQWWNSGSGGTYTCGSP
jgi:Flp pilus assembly protein TadG